MTSRNEFWFLDAAIENRVPIPLLINQEYVELSLNRIFHGLTMKQIAVELFDLNQRGLVNFFICSDEADCEKCISFKDSNSLEIQCSQSNNHRCFCYELTAEGGVQIESLSILDWSKYLSFEGFSFDFQDDTGEYFMAKLEAMTNKPIFDYCKSDSLEYTKWGNTEELIPWQATYWKQVAQGVRINFKCRARALKLELGMKDITNSNYRFVWRKYGFSNDCEYIVGQHLDK